MGFWSKIFGKDKEKDDATMPNPAAPAEEKPEETADVSQEETKE